MIGDSILLDTASQSTEKLNECSEIKEENTKEIEPSAVEKLVSSDTGKLSSNKEIKTCDDKLSKVLTVPNKCVVEESYVCVFKKEKGKNLFLVLSVVQNVLYLYWILGIVWEVISTKLTVLLFNGALCIS